MSADTYDAILVVSFGGPEKRDDVMPFLENVTRGRNIPRNRLLEVAEHYYHFDGVSPLNQQVRELIAALTPELHANGITLPIYWGNRNWHPLLADTMQQMKTDGIGRAIALVLSAYSSYSSCRQYRENIAAAQQTVGEDAPVVDKIRVFYNHPDFVAASTDRVRDALSEFADEERTDIHIAYTAHSIPSSMAENCNYELQLKETCRLISESLHITPDRWNLVYQSRSGPPSMPWLEPDICDHLEALHKQGVRHVIVAPVGFLSDHMEVLYDLDDEAARKATELGIIMARAATVGTHPRFLRMLRELIQERIEHRSERPAVGEYPASHDVCPVDCCPAPARPAGRPQSAKPE